VGETNLELARRGYEAALRGDVDALRDLLDPEVKWHAGDVAASTACHNRDEALAFMRKARRRRPLAELVELVDAGEKVVVIVRPQSASAGEAALSANVTTFRDGKVVEMVHYDDPSDALAAAGV
jgi:ketosteroid isomerase-like protein